MVFLCMMCLIEDKKVDLVDGNERVHETLVEDFCRTDDNHVFLEYLPPGFLCPKIAAHFPTEVLNLLV